MLLCLLFCFWGGQYREELILNVTVFVVRVWGGQYREELILSVTVFVVRCLGRAIWRGTDTEYYSVVFVVFVEGNIERN